MKRWVVIALTFCMMLSLLPFAASAVNSADPVRIQEGDVIETENGWYHVSPNADGIYAFPQKDRVAFVVRPTKDTSQLNEAEIEYLHAQMVSEVYAIILENAEVSVSTGEQDIQKAKDSLPAQQAQLEADRKIISNLEQIETLVQEFARRQNENKPPIGFFSIESWYRISVRPRLAMMGYAAPEDADDLWSNWLEKREQLRSFDEEERRVERIPDQISEAEALLAEAKAQLEALRQTAQAKNDAAAKCKSALSGTAPSTDDFLLTDWSVNGVYMQENEVYWVYIGSETETVKTTVHAWDFHLNDELNQSGVLGDLSVADGTYVLVMRTDGTEETYYNGMLIRTELPENGMLSIPDSVDDVTVTEVGANLIENGKDIQSVTIPASITRIQTGAFQDCTNLRDVYYEGTQAQWDKIHISSNNEPLKAAVLHVLEAEEDPSVTPVPTNTAEELVFNDVPEGVYYTEAVAWAVENEITNGIAEKVFSPDGDCTRAQVVTFLWRAAGSPEADYRNPFRDVKEDSYYYKAVLWAASRGIALGTSLTTFSPDTPCTRAQVVTFLWRDLDGKPTISEAGFSDVQAGAYYYVPVTWAVKNGVTKGVDETHFAPDAFCTRGQVVTFLHRAKL